VPGRERNTLGNVPIKFEISRGKEGITKYLKKLIMIANFRGYADERQRNSV